MSGGLGEWSLERPSMTLRDLEAELEAAGRDCPVCEEPLRPSREPVTIYSVRIGVDRIALMPFHRRCWPQARERIERAKADVAARSDAAGSN